MSTFVTVNRRGSATLISRWSGALIPFLIVVRFLHAADTVDVAAIMQRVRANRPAVSLWLEAELRIEREIANSYTLNIFLNGDPRELRMAYRMTGSDKTVGTAALMIEGGDWWFCEGDTNGPRKITRPEQAKPFLGSDFAYEDIDRSFLRWPNHKFIRESRRRGVDCWVIESTPSSDRPSQYNRVLSWVDKEYMVIISGEAYDTKGRLLKNLEVKSVRRLNDGSYVIGEMAVSNVQSKSRSVLRVLEDHKSKLAPEFFLPETFFRATAAPPKNR